MCIMTYQFFFSVDCDLDMFIAKSVSKKAPQAKFCDLRTYRGEDMRRKLRRRLNLLDLRTFKHEICVENSAAGEFVWFGWRTNKGDIFVGNSAAGETFWTSDLQ